MTTTIDVNINGVRFIMEVTLDDMGTSYLTLTEACNHPQSETCPEHQTYDFQEVE